MLDVFRAYKRERDQAQTVIDRIRAVVKSSAELGGGQHRHTNLVMDICQILDRGSDD